MNKVDRLAKETYIEISENHYGKSGSEFISIRKYAKNKSVSYKTAYRVYKKLENSGVIFLLQNTWYITFGICESTTALYKHNDKPIIGVHVREINNSYIASSCSEIKKVADQAKYRVIICTSENNSDQEREYLKFFINIGCSGVINFPSTDEKNIDYYKLYPLPMVVIGRHIPNSNLPCVMTDNYNTGKHIAKYLSEKGYKRFYHLCNESLKTSSNERLRGYCDYLSSYTDFSEKNIIKLNLDEDFAFRNVAEKFKFEKSDEPIGVFCFNDLFAAKLIKFLNKAQVSVPDKVGVIGYDNLSVCMDVSPKITSVAYQFSRMAAESFKLLKEIILTRSTKPNYTILIPNYIISRDSTNLKIKG